MNSISETALLTAREQCIVERVQSCIKAAARLYSVDLGSVDIQFDLRGRAAGQAALRWGQYSVRFNRAMIATDSYEHVLNQTVPHEVAHLVCYARPALGRGHNPGWQRVCIALGGDGQRCHDQFVIYARGSTYRYKTTLGYPIPVSERVHLRIQQGAEYRVKGRGHVRRGCEYELVQQSKQQSKQQTTASSRVNSTSKAAQLRSYIAEAKSRGVTQDTVTIWAMLHLNLSHGLARTYVKNNWHRVGV